MREQIFTQIVTSNLGKIKMIHKIQLLLQLLKLTHKHKRLMSGNKLIILFGVVPTIANVCGTF